MRVHYGMIRPCSCLLKKRVGRALGGRDAGAKHPHIFHRARAWGCGPLAEHLRRFRLVVSAGFNKAT
jgi:hypothetical protein